MTEVEASLLGAIIGGAIGVIGTYFGTIQTAKKNRRADANIVFYESFRKVLRDLGTTANPLPEISGIINHHIGDHTSAMFRFKFFLPKDERRCFLTAWEEYYNQYKSQAFADNGEINKRAEKKQLALNHIYKLLKFADYEK